MNAVSTKAKAFVDTANRDRDWAGIMIGQRAILHPNNTDALSSHMVANPRRLMPGEILRDEAKLCGNVSPVGHYLSHLDGRPLSV